MFCSGQNAAMLLLFGDTFQPIRGKEREEFCSILDGINDPPRSSLTKNNTRNKSEQPLLFTLRNMKLVLKATLVAVMLGAAYAAVLLEVSQKEYRDLIREARSSSESDSHSHEHLNVPGLGLELPHLHLDHHRGHHHGHQSHGSGEGHVMASWHDGHRGGASSSSSESDEYETCVCDPYPRWRFNGYPVSNSGNYEPSQSVIGVRPWQYFYARQRFGIRRHGSATCICPEVPTDALTTSMIQSSTSTTASTAATTASTAATTA